MVLPAKVFRIPCAPSKWSHIGWAITVIRDCMLTQLEEERRSVAEGQPGTGTLMSNLVRASDEGTQVMSGYSDALNHGVAAGPKPLTVDEILGNVFVFNLAGHDTIAISLAYSMMLLVAHSVVQDWIAENLNFYLPDGNSESRKYEDAFPKLKRCLAILVLGPDEASLPTQNHESNTHAARDSPSLQSTSGSPQVYGNAIQGPQGERSRYPHSRRYPRRPKSHGLTHPSTLLGPRLPYVETLSGGLRMTRVLNP